MQETVRKIKGRKNVSISVIKVIKTKWNSKETSSEKKKETSSGFLEQKTYIQYVTLN